MKPQNPAANSSATTSPPQVVNEKKALGVADKQEAKLDLEIQNLEIKNRREGRRQWTPIIATALAVAGFSLTVLQFQCGQQRARALQDIEEQKDRRLREAEQLSRCQQQLRADSDELIKSAREQTSSRVLFLLEDARAALACKVGENQTLAQLFPNYERALTESFVRLVRDDLDFTKNGRDVTLANAIADRWVDYGTYLRDRPKELDYIIYKYTRALQDMRDQNPGYVDCLDVDVGTNQVTVCRQFEKKKNEPALYNYFSDVIAGFQSHLKFLDDNASPTDAKERRNKVLLDFQEAICRRVISEHFVGTYLEGGTCQ